MVVLYKYFGVILGYFPYNPHPPTKAKGEASSLFIILRTNFIEKVMKFDTILQYFIIEQVRLNPKVAKLFCHFSEFNLD